MASASTIECPIIPREQLIKVKEFPAAVGGYGQVFQCIMQRAGAPGALVGLFIINTTFGIHISQVAVKVLIHASKKVDLYFHLLHETSLITSNCSVHAVR